MSPRPLLLLSPLLFACSPAGPAADAPRPEAEFVGRASCVTCHELEGQLYEDSHHDLAMDAPTPETVLGDFDGATHDHYGVVTTFTRDGDRYLVETDGPDGTPTTYEVAYVFGVDPLQQYLVRFRSGAMQCLAVAWDSRPADDGGQRWIHLYPDEAIPHNDVLHWTGRHQRWNTMCARCHSTGLERGYDQETRRYDTTWHEIDVSCEACHGPGAEHVAWANGERPEAQSYGLAISLKDPNAGKWALDLETGNAVRTAERGSRAQSETCARCHSRRATIDEAHVDGSSFHDQYRLALLHQGLYHADGQILDEVYVYGSFLQSKMHAEGVTCSDCHDPHTAELLYEGNALCARCHVPAKYDTPEHHHHPLGGDGAQCVDCHMPSKTYMVVDPRRDHSLRVPRPDLSEKLGTPNACSSCHDDQDASWAAEQVRGWFPEGQHTEFHYGEALAAAWRGTLDAEAKLTRVVADPEQPAIVRATALDLMRGAGTREGAQAILASLADEDPMVRAAAVGLFDAQPESHQARRHVVPHLEDPVLFVRAEAARVLAPVKDLPAEDQPAFAAALEDFVSTQLANADRPASQLTLGTFRMQRNRLIDAERAFREALELDPTFFPAIGNLADVLRARDRDDLAEPVLEAGIKGFPNNPALLQSMGLLYARTGRAEEGTALLGRAAALDPPNSRLVYTYAVALGSTNRVEDALGVLDEAHLRFPANVDVLQALATYSRDLGRLPQAVEYARRMCALMPEDRGALQLLQSLQQAAAEDG